MAIQVSGTEVISNARALNNIASVDATTVTSLNDAGVGGGFKPVSVSGATPALNVGTYNFFNAGDLTIDTTISFTSVPTDALWTYTASVGVKEAFTLTSAVYTGRNKYVPEETGAAAVQFSSDGTKMYVVGTSTDTVYQYTLSTAWQVDTATYASLSKDVSAQESAPRGLFFKPDGLTMYIVGSGNDTVYQYTLSTAWAINTASYASLSKDVSAQEVVPDSVFFKPDGLTMYIVGQSNDTVYQYTLSTAWNVSTASYASLSKDVSAQELTPNGLAFSSDGLKMFIVGPTSDTVYQYTLSTAWNVSTASYASISFSFVQDSSPTAVTFKTDGTRMYIVGSSAGRVYEYTSYEVPTITVPAAVENPPATAFPNDSQVSYTFVTNDGGTTVNLIGRR
jgi:sugar lactone lactonase YvrE